MRDILFRGKRVDNGEWVYGWLGHPHSYNPHEKSISSIYFTKITEEFDSYLNIIVDYKTVGQYTGLKDKNDTKIFEGDVIKINGCEHMINGEYAVIYDDKNHCWALERSYEHHFSYFTFSDLNLNSFAETFEVIGNIHDNPELLEVQE